MKQTRIDLTEKEWREVRKAAVDANLSVPEYLAHLLRETLGLIARA